jgi:hypothetical protein
VVFAAEASWKGKLTALGFEEDLIDLAPPAAGGQDAGQFWKEFVAQTAPEFRKPTIEQLETWIKPVWEELISGVKYSHQQLTGIVARVRPDVIVEDNVVAFPALVTGDTPFVRIVSCNPLEIKGPDVPPAFSGYPAAAPGGWPEFRAEYERVHRPLWQEFNGWVTGQGAPPLPDLEFIGEGDANLYVYPKVADYRRRPPLGPGWHRLDSCVRATDEELARIGRRRADAPGDRLPGPHPAPVRRVQGPAALRDRPRAEHVGRRVRAAGLSHPAGRPGHHARRQQHHHREPALRQADGDVAAVLGPARQRAADRRAWPRCAA